MAADFIVPVGLVTKRTLVHIGRHYHLCVERCPLPRIFPAVGLDSLTQIVEGNPVATIVIDAQHRVTHWNRAIEVLTGLSASEMVGTDGQWRAFYGSARPIPADLSSTGRLEDSVDHFYHGKFRRSPLIEGAFKARISSPFHGRVGKMALLHAPHPGCRRSHRRRHRELCRTSPIDIWPWRRCGKARVPRPNRAGSSVATFVIDRDHRITHWNPGLRGDHRASRHAMVGTRDHWRPLLSQSAPLMADLVLDRASEGTVRNSTGASTGLPCSKGLTRLRTFSQLQGRGRPLVVYFTAAPLRNSRGEVVGRSNPPGFHRAAAYGNRPRGRAKNAIASRASPTPSPDCSIPATSTNDFTTRSSAPSAAGRPSCPPSSSTPTISSANDTYGHLQGDQVLVGWGDQPPFRSQRQRSLLHGGVRRGHARGAPGAGCPSRRTPAAQFSPIRPYVLPGGQYPVHYQCRRDANGWPGERRKPHPPRRRRRLSGQAARQELRRHHGAFQATGAGAPELQRHARTLSRAAGAVPTIREYCGQSPRPDQSGERVPPDPQ